MSGNSPERVHHEVAPEDALIELHRRAGLGAEGQVRVESGHENSRRLTRTTRTAPLRLSLRRGRRARKRFRPGAL